MASKSNWPKLLIFGAAVVGVGAAAVFYVKKMKEKSSNVDGMVDDMVAFCKKKAGELDNLLNDSPDRKLESA